MNAKRSCRHTILGTHARLVLAWFFFLVPGASSLAADAGQLLADIRQTLLSQAVDSGVKVMSAGFVDSQGKLHESAYFESGTEVRGVRVRSYLQSSGALDSKPELLPLALRSPGQCSAGRIVKYSRPLFITVSTSDVIMPLNQLTRADLQSGLEEVLLDALAQGGLWQPIPWGPRVANLSPYTLLLTGFRLPEAEYRLHVEVTTARQVPGEDGHSALRQAVQGAPALMRRVAATNPVIPVDNPARYPAEILQFHLSLADRFSGDLLLEQSFTIQLPGMRANLRQTDLLVGMLPRMREAGVELARAMARLPGCQLAQVRIFGLPDDTGQTLRVDLGADNGVNLGARFLLSTTDLTRGGSVLNPAVMEGLAIAEVVALANHSAQLRIIAGQENLPDYRFAVPF